MSLLTNLRAYYKCEDTSDASGNGYTLTNVSSVTFTDGKISNCANISSRGSAAKCLRISSDLGITGGAITIAGWYLSNSNPTGVFGAGDSIADQGDGGNDVNNWITYNRTGGVPTLNFNRQRAGVANDNYNYTTTLTTGTWYHIAYVYDGTTVQGYLNGSAVGAGVASSGNGSAVNDDHFILGGVTNGAGGQNWKPDGKLDEWGVWSRALSSAEISELYNSGSGVTYPFSTPSVTTENSSFFGGGL